MKIEEIEKAVCDYYNIEPGILKSRSRKREIVKPRQVAMHFSKKHCKSMQLAEIGNYFGRYDRATVLHSHEAVLNMIDTDRTERLRIFEIERRLTMSNMSKSAIIANDIREIASRLTTGNVAHMKGSLNAIAQAVEALL